MDACEELEIPPEHAAEIIASLFPRVACVEDVYRIESHASRDYLLAVSDARYSGDTAT